MCVTKQNQVPGSKHSIPILLTHPKKLINLFFIPFFFNQKDNTILTLEAIFLPSKQKQAKQDLKICPLHFPNSHDRF